jgi:hypothetical protein
MFYSWSLIHQDTTKPLVAMTGRGSATREADVTLEPNLAHSLTDFSRMRSEERTIPQRMHKDPNRVICSIRNMDAQKRRQWHTGKPRPVCFGFKVVCIINDLLECIPDPQVAYPVAHAATESWMDDPLMVVRRVSRTSCPCVISDRF